MYLELARSIFLCAAAWIYFLDPSQDRTVRFLSKIDHVHYYESVNDNEGQNEFQPYRPGRSDTCRLVAHRIYDACPIKGEAQPPVSLYYRRQCVPQGATPGGSKGAGGCELPTSSLHALC